MEILVGLTIGVLRGLEMTRRGDPCAVDERYGGVPLLLANLDGPTRRFPNFFGLLP